MIRYKQNFKIKQKRMRPYMKSALESHVLSDEQTKKKQMILSKLIWPISLRLSWRKYRFLNFQLNWANEAEKSFLI